MLGTRGVWRDGWHASAVHPAMGDWGGFEKDRWELFNLEEDRSQSTDLAEKHPEKLKELQELWTLLAGKFQALPLDDRGAAAILGCGATAAGQAARPVRLLSELRACAGRASARARCSARSTSRRKSRSRTPSRAASSSLRAATSAATRCTCKQGKLHYVYNWLGEIQQKVSSSKPLTSGKAHARRELRGEEARRTGQSGGTSEAHDRWHGGGSRRSRHNQASSVSKGSSPSGATPADPHRTTTCRPTPSVLV